LSEQLPIEHTIVLVENPPAPQVDQIFAAIRAYNHPWVGEWNPLRIAFFAHDPQGHFLGGIYGIIARGWFFLDGLAVSEPVRDQGLGTQLLQAAEGEARQHGCHHAWLETYSFQARPFYERHGYTVFGTLDDYPIGHSRYFMQKALEVATT
jgi:GNAT superfamily N-acetyltransferase